MGKIPNELRATIGKNIRSCRRHKFPGRGGAKKCAEKFGVSPQQWSPWETGMRTPGEERMIQIAKFFETTVEWLRTNHESVEKEDTTSSEQGQSVSDEYYTQSPPPRDGNDNRTMNTGMAGLHSGAWINDAPGTAASFFWLARHFILHLQQNGLRLDKQCLEYLAKLLK